MAPAGPFDDLSREDLIELLAADNGGRIRISFVGKANARRIARKVRPRVLRPVKALSAGIPEEQARNQLIEGDNLQAMATLYRERSQVDLILTDPPYKAQCSGPCHQGQSRADGNVVLTGDRTLKLGTPSGVSVGSTGAEPDDRVPALAD